METISKKNGLRPKGTAVWRTGGDISKLGMLHPIVSSSQLCRMGQRRSQPKPWVIRSHTFRLMLFIQKFNSLSKMYIFHGYLLKWSLWDTLFAAVDAQDSWSSAEPSSGKQPKLCASLSRSSLPWTSENDV